MHVDTGSNPEEANRVQKRDESFFPSVTHVLSHYTEYEYIILLVFISRHPIYRHT